MDAVRQDCSGITAMSGAVQPPAASSSCETASWRPWNTIARAWDSAEERKKKNRDVVPASCTRALPVCCASQPVLPSQVWVSSSLAEHQGLFHPSAPSHLVLGHNFLPEVLQRGLSYSEFCFFFNVLLLLFFFSFSSLLTSAWPSGCSWQVTEQRFHFPLQFLQCATLTWADTPGTVL